MKGADALKIMRWINGMDFMEFCQALEITDLESNPRRQEYWLEKFAEIKRDLFRGLCEQLDPDNMEKLWAHALAKDAAWKAKNNKA